MKSNIRLIEALSCIGIMIIFLIMIPVLLRLSATSMRTRDCWRKREAMELSKKSQSFLELLKKWANEPANIDKDFFFEMEKSYTPGFFVKIWGMGEDIPEYPSKHWMVAYSDEVSKDDRTITTKIIKKPGEPIYIDEVVKHL